ncbi:hypothetical protein [Desulforhopalus sp. IMCC35007]|uniref:hypothetical protein n=1 Tax=Desulforhopalus sp. IMCC35007 TaxID=2569543 RepID=UPI0010AE3A1B|nr:hypothetical protein [Desulforhopalus sp. IMCC35007]TKB07675.1 hypothetical protein FCL48_16755 [Desulforhopalus sp. IMCC35007]
MNKNNLLSRADTNLMTIESEEQKADDNIKSLPIIEKQPDNVLVEEARSKLQGIFVSHYQEALQNALLDAGMYIIEKFYNNDYELARQNKPQKELSYVQLVELLNDQNENSPKKSWLYNAVNLAVQEQQFPTFHALGKLNTTHKLLLLTVRDSTLKQSLAEETEKYEYSTRQLAKRIQESKKQRGKTIFSYLSKPEELFSGSNNHLFSSDTLKKFNLKKIEALREKLNIKVQEIQSVIMKQKQLEKQYEKLLKTVDRVEQEKQCLSSPDEETLQKAE